MKKLIAIAVLLISSAAVSDDKKPDPWQPIRFMVGNWHGTVTGESGTGTVTRSYQFVLNDRFIQEHNTSSYAPTDKNPKGEVHEHLGMISYDRQRKVLMMRQFHPESFVNLYALNATASKDGLLEFESEDFENFDDAWKAKETYEVISKDEFIEIFELAPPGKPFEVYSRNHFKRVSHDSDSN